RSIGNAESGCAANHAGSTDSTTRPADPASFACAAATGSPSARTTAGAANDTADPAPGADRTAKANDDPARRSLIRTDSFTSPPVTVYRRSAPGHTPGYTTPSPPAVAARATCA